MWDGEGLGLFSGREFSKRSKTLVLISRSKFSRSLDHRLSREFGVNLLVVTCYTCVCL